MTLQAALLLCGYPGAASAQVEELVPVGARIRLSAPDQGLRRHVAIVMAVSRDSLWVETSPGRGRSIARDDVTGLDVSIGRRRHTWKGAALGLAAGTAVGISDEIFSALLFCPLSVDEICVLDPWPFDGLTYDTRRLAVAGAALGTLAGALMRTDQWRAVVTPSGDGTRVQVAARRGGTGPGVGFTVTARRRRSDQPLRFPEPSDPGASPPPLGAVAMASLLASAGSFVAGAYAGYHIEEWLYPCEVACDFSGLAGLLVGSFVGPAIATPLVTHLANGRRGRLGIAYGAAAAVAGAGFVGLVTGLDSSIGTLFLFGTPLAQSVAALLIERVGAR